MLRNLLVLALGFGTHLAAGNPIKSRSPLVVKDSHFVPSKWTNVGDAPGDHVIELRIGVKQGHFDALEKHLYEGKNTYAGVPFTMLTMQSPIRTTSVTVITLVLQRSPSLSVLRKTLYLSSTSGSRTTPSNQLNSATPHQRTGSSHACPFLKSRNCSTQSIPFSSTKMAAELSELRNGHCQSIFTSTSTPSSLQIRSSAPLPSPAL